MKAERWRIEQPEEKEAEEQQETTTKLSEEREATVEQPEEKEAEEQQETTTKLSEEREATVDTTHTQCNHNGCEIKVPACDLENHEKNCFFKTIECSISECSEKIVAKDLDEHVRKKHRKGSRIKWVPSYVGGAKYNKAEFKVSVLYYTRCMSSHSLT